MSSKKVKVRNSNILLPKIILGCLSLMVVILVIAYLCISQYYKQHFYAKTYINGMDCSNLTADEAKEIITNNVNTYVLTVTARDGSSQKIQGKDIDLKCVFDQDLSSVLEEQSAYAWLGNALKENDVDNPYTLTYDKDKLQKTVKKLDCMAKGKQVEPTNAKISKYDKKTGFTIIKEEQGNKLDKKKVTNAIITAIGNLDDTLSLEEADCYTKPEITTESECIKNAMDKINTYMSTRITYKFGEKTEVLDGKVIGPAVKVNKKMNAKINQETIKEYVTYLAKTYNTVGGPWKFNTSYGTTVTVSGGTYGWKLDQTKELTELMELIKEGKQQEKKPISQVEGEEYGKSQIGDTYVEVNVTRQHMYFYKNGQLIVDSNVVTGIPKNGHSTPSGVYWINYKERNRVLRGNNDNGSKYNTKVSYWMPFTENGIGLHDAWWRGVFGGNRYTYDGSHGCVNLPTSVAAQLYASAEAHTLVVVYRE